MSAVATLPRGPYPADIWGSLLNLPVDQIRDGATVMPFGFGGLLFQFQMVHHE